MYVLEQRRKMDQVRSCLTAKAWHTPKHNLRCWTGSWGCWFLLAIGSNSAWKHEEPCSNFSTQFHFQDGKSSSESSWRSAQLTLGLAIGAGGTALKFSISSWQNFHVPLDHTKPTRHDHYTIIGYIYTYFHILSPLLASSARSAQDTFAPAPGRTGEGARDSKALSKGEEDADGTWVEPSESSPWRWDGWSTRVAKNAKVGTLWQILKKEIPRLNLQWRINPIWNYSNHFRITCFEPVLCVLFVFDINMTRCNPTSHPIWGHEDHAAHRPSQVDQDFQKAQAVLEKWPYLGKEKSLQQLFAKWCPAMLRRKFRRKKWLWENNGFWKCLWNAEAVKDRGWRCLNKWISCC